MNRSTCPITAVMVVVPFGLQRGAVSGVSWAYRPYEGCLLPPFVATLAPASKE